MTAGPARWTARGASAMGSAHLRTGAPNQDAYAVWTGRTALVAAVADGHGGRRYVRSGLGAQLAVSIAIQLGADLLERRRPDPMGAAPGLPAEVVARWRQTVLAHHDTHPLTPDEVGRAGDLDDPALLYGATLIVALASDDLVAVVQVGDGSVVVGDAGGVTRPVPGDPRLVANETTSLCLTTAIDDFRWGATELTSPSSLVLLSTDGYGNSFASDDWETEVMADLVAQVGRHGFGKVAAELDGWASESAEVGGDDATLVLLQRTATPRRGRLASVLLGNGAATAARPAHTTANDRIPRRTR